MLRNVVDVNEFNWVEKGEIPKESEILCIGGCVIKLINAMKKCGASPVDSNRKDSEVVAMREKGK